MFLLFKFLFIFPEIKVLQFYPKTERLKIQFESIDGREIYLKTQRYRVSIDGRGIYLKTQRYRVIIDGREISARINKFRTKS